MKVFYHGDNDGRCAAFLFWKWLATSEATPEELEAAKDEFIETDYNKPLMLTERIQPDETVYFLDFHPQIEEDYVWLRQHTNLRIIDHHKTTVPHIAKMDAKFGFDPSPDNIIDESACGAMLVAERFLRLIDETMPYFVTAVDDWDRWVHKDPAAKLFNAGSKIHDTSPFGTFWNTLYNEHESKMTGVDSFLWSLIAEGRIIIDSVAMQAKELCKSIGFEAEFEGYKCFALNQSRCDSTWFESKPGYDIYLPFNFDGSKWTVSLYSKTIDVSVIAKEYGGGGHAGASGFVCDELPFRKAT